MRILVDKNNPFVAEAFSDFGEVRAISTAEFTPEMVQDVDALVIRSETRITQGLLERSRVRFVGSATIGTDHVDLDFLDQRGIAFSNAPGCNANSVAEYFVAALLRFAETEGMHLAGRTIGVVGVGNVGSKVVKKAEALGFTVLQNDPPKRRATGDPSFVDLDDLMGADFVSLHVPLTNVGPDATHHLFDARRIAKMKRGSILVNTARGSVVATEAVKEALRSGHLGAALLDVWENEPGIDTELLSMAQLGTPHIAGYSFDGKLNAVRMIHSAMAQVFRIAPRWRTPAALPPPKTREVAIGRDRSTRFQSQLHEIVRLCYDIESDDMSLRELLRMDPAKRSAHFRRLRAEYPVRREFGATTIRLASDDVELRKLLGEIGFQVL